MAVVGQGLAGGQHQGNQHQDENFAAFHGSLPGKKPNLGIPGLDARLQRKLNFSDRLALDTYRLSLATGSMDAANDYMEMTQLALQAGFPAEAKQVLDKGFATNVLGTGPEAERHKRLRDLVAKRLDEDKKNQAETLTQAQEAKDGTALVNAGMNLVFNGDKAKGLQVMQQGVAKGGFKRVVQPLRFASDFVGVFRFNLIVGVGFELAEPCLFLVGELLLCGEWVGADADDDSVDLFE